MKKMKALAIAMVLLAVAMIAVGCGKGGLTNYFGLKENNISKIEYYYQTGKSPKTIDLSKAGKFMDVFDVDYTGCDRSDISTGAPYYRVTFNQDGTTRTLILYVQPDGRIGASMYDGVVTIYYKSTTSITIPWELKS